MPFKVTRPGTIARTECQMFRDFCASVSVLMDQFERFERSGTLSHPALNDLLGEADNRGPLWRLKDAAHILFAKQKGLSGQLLDRTFGSIFHEAIKLMEATYQSQHYANTCKIYAASLMPQLDGTSPQLTLPCKRQQTLLSEATSGLLTILEDSTGDVKRGIGRLKALLHISRPLLCICFTGKGSNQMLAKYLEGRNDVIKRVMDFRFEEFVQSLQMQAIDCP